MVLCLALFATILVHAVAHGESNLAGSFDVARKQAFHIPIGQIPPGGLDDVTVQAKGTSNALNLAR